MITKILIVVILSLFLLTSCRFFQSAEREVCKKILSKEQMTDILFDLYITEGFLTERQAQLAFPQDSVAIFFDGILEKHQVSFQTFQEALNCYLMHPLDLEIIHEALLTRLKVERTRLQAESYRKAREAERPVGYVWALPETPDVPSDTLNRHSIRQLVPEVFFWQ